MDPDHNHTILDNDLIIISLNHRGTEVVGSHDGKQTQVKAGV